MERIHNFSAGPASIPIRVLEQINAELFDLSGTGMSILEISHRSTVFDGVIEDAKANIRRLLNIPDQYHILFLQGGASLQFSMIPINFLSQSVDPAYYVVAGTWGKKAIEQAIKEGDAKELWDGSDQNFRRMPSLSELTLDSEACYVHITSNETIHGVQLHCNPNFDNVPLICDMSSDFLSKPFPIDNYSLLYAGAQKNLGPAGLTVVIIREEMLGQINSQLHSMLDYRVYVEKQSLYNTPPVFPIYVTGLVTKWLIQEIGGLEKMAEYNEKKASILYNVIDESSGFYQGYAFQNSRSLMNVTWSILDKSLEQNFLQEAEENGLYNLKGHRSIGGLRASLYNAVTLESVHVLEEFMRYFQSRWG